MKPNEDDDVIPIRRSEGLREHEALFEKEVEDTISFNEKMIENQVIIHSANYPQFPYYFSMDWVFRSSSDHSMIRILSGKE
jgi:hypothetical protein